MTDAHGVKVELPAGKLALGARLAVSGQTLVSPLTFAPGKTPLSVAGKPYRGRLLVFSTGGRSRS